MSATFRAFSLKNIIFLIIFIAIPLAVGGLSAALTKDSMMIYNSYRTPPLSPPSSVFPIVWTILFILMGIASYLVWRFGKDRNEVKEALYYYAAQLVFNFLWTIVFFNLRMLLTAFVVLVILWILIGITTAKFYRIYKLSGILMLPYWLWVTFAGYLNLAIWILNR